MAQEKESTEKKIRQCKRHTHKQKRILHRFEKYYRSISLLSHLYKVITNILTNRIKNQFKKEQKKENKQD